MLSETVRSGLGFAKVLFDTLLYLLKSILPADFFNGYNPNDHDAILSSFFNKLVLLILGTVYISIYDT